MSRSSSHNRFFLIPLCVGILAGTLTACAQDPVALPALEDRDAGRVTSTAAFTFYSRFWVNLHDYLYQAAQQEGEQDGRPACLEGLRRQQHASWQTTVAFYQEEMGHRHHRLDDLMRTVRLTLTGLEGEPASHDSLVVVLDHLRQAGPAYAACWWSDHDRRNRAWIDALTPLLEAHEDTLIARLSRAYQDPWPADVFPVDVVGYASWAGANTITTPSHLLMSSVNEGYQGPAALEMVFHEASHTVLGARFGTIAEHIEEASRAHGKRPPSNLWHAILFLTTGITTQEILATAGAGNYTPYVYKRGLFDRSWSAYREPLEQHWPRYLEHEIDLHTALVNVVDAILTP